MRSTISLADAKSTLSAVVRDVGASGAQYVVTVRGVPAAMIVPIPKETPKTLKARGILAGYSRSDVVSREDERSAYREAVEARYANLSRC